MKEKRFAIPHRLRDVFQNELADHKIIFVSAGAGWGKSSGIRKCLSGKNAVYITAEGDRVPRLPAKETLVVLDDFQKLSPQFDKRMAEIIFRSPKRQRLVILSRGPLPDYLLPCQYSSDLLLLTEEDLALAGAEVTQLASASGALFSRDDLRRILHETRGYPPYINYLLDALPESGACTSAIEPARRRLYTYFDSELYCDWDRRTRMVLLSASYFQTITTSLMETVLARSDAGDILRHIYRSTGVLRPGPGDVWRYSTPALMGSYLRQKAERVMAPGDIERLHILSGDWCKEHAGYLDAMEHYSAAGRRELELQTLADAVRHDNRAFVICQFADCLHGMTESELRSAPELAYAMSRVSGLFFDLERAERWRRVLEEMAEEPDACARAWLAHLELCLPQAVASGREGHARMTFADIRPIPVNSRSLTASLPSVLRGERDLTCLARQPVTASDRSLLDGLQAALGEHAGSFLELLHVEYRQEQGENVDTSLHQWQPLQLRLREQGALELEFVCVVLTARTLCAEGQIPEAASYLLRFRHRAEAAGACELLPNIDAARCRIALMEDSIYAAQWLDEQTPTGGVVSLLDGYRLLTRARCHIKREEYRTAALFLGQLMDGYERCGRTLEHMETLILGAICLYRLGAREWRTYFGRALMLGEQDRFVAVFAREGAALLPLLEEFVPDRSVAPRYWGDILRKTMSLAGRCPAYLRPERYLTKPLTAAEHTVLLLLMRRKSTGEMAHTLGVKASTVQTHLRHIFFKLGVHSKGEAREAAIRFKLV